MSKVCHFCGNKNFIRKNVQYTYKHDNKFLIIDDVPCEQCEFCGEQYFEASVLKSIEAEYEKIYSFNKKPKSEITVPIEKFTELEYA